MKGSLAILAFISAMIPGHSVLADTLSPIPGSLDGKTATLPDVGHEDPGTTIDFDIGLGFRDPQGLDDYLKNLYDPSSPIFHQWLTPEQFCLKFGPDPASVQELSGYYTAFGITAQAESGCTLLSFRATVSEIEAAFATKIELYTFNGKPTHANSTPLMAPQTLLPLISGVMGIDGLIPPPHPGGQPHPVSPHPAQ